MIARYIEEGLFSRKGVIIPFKQWAPCGFLEDNFIRRLELQISRSTYNSLFTSKECCCSQGSCSMDSVKLSISNFGVRV